MKQHTLGGGEYLTDANWVYQDCNEAMQEERLRTPSLGVTATTVQDQQCGPIEKYTSNQSHLMTGALGDTAVQLALAFQWGDTEPPDLHETRLSPAEFVATRRLLTIALEILDGRRPLFDLYGQLSENLYAALAANLRRPRPLQAPARLRSIHAQRPVRNVIEACGVLDRGRKAQALAARLEHRRRGWIGTMLGIL